MIDSKFYVDGVLAIEAVAGAAYILVGVAMFLITSSFILYWDPNEGFFAVIGGAFLGLAWGLLLFLGLLYVFPWAGAKLLRARDRWNG